MYSETFLQKNLGSEIGKALSSQACIFLTKFLTAQTCPFLTCLEKQHMAGQVSWSSAK